MSDYLCPEPGCMFHIGIAGDLVTAEDFEAQDYYDQEIEEHEQMHADERKLSPGQRLKELREHRELEQAQLAVELQTFGVNWSRATLSKVERGEREIRLIEVPGICLALRLEKIEDFWTPGKLTRPGPINATEALAEIRVVLAELDSIAKEMPPAVAPAEGDETKYPNR